MKIFLFLSVTFLCCAVQANVENYKLNDQNIDEMFVEAEEVDFELFINTMSCYSEHNTTLSEKDRVVAGILGLFLGAFGVHRAYSQSPFKVWGIYAGITVGGVVCGTGAALFGCPLLIPLASLPGIVGLIDGIIILIATDEEYQSKWVGSTALFNW